MVGRLLIRRAWLEPVDPDDFPDLDLPDPEDVRSWSCTVEYGETVEASHPPVDSRFDEFDTVLAWALAEGAEEINVWSRSERQFERFAIEDAPDLRAEHGRRLA